jgi:transposase-like protein
MMCLFCKSKNIIKAGKRYNKYQVKQIYQCKKCDRRFVERDGFEGMTYPPKLIAKVLHLYVEGLSLSKIRDYVKQHLGYKLCDGTILYWVRKYSKVEEMVGQRSKPKLNGRIHIDEVVLKIGKKVVYCLNAIDSKTKFNLESRLVDSLSLENIRPFFKSLKDKLYDQILAAYKFGKELIIFVTDKLGQYRNAFNKYFWRIAKLVFGVPIACKKFGLKHNNNPIERHNQDIKQRYKVMRHFKSFDSASAFIKLRRVIYNFVRSHSSLGGKTPAEKAGIGLDLGRNKLLDLIKICFLPA